MDTATRQGLERSREWAKERLRSGTEPPWSYYRLMQLVDAVDSLLAGQSVVSPMDHLQQSEPTEGVAPPQEGNIYRLDAVQRHRAETPIQMPT
jgi:hypothetical protein